MAFTAIDDGNGTTAANDVVVASGILVASLVVVAAAAGAVVACVCMGAYGDDADDRPDSSARFK